MIYRADLNEGNFWNLADEMGRISWIFGKDSGRLQQGRETLIDLKRIRISKKELLELRGLWMWGCEQLQPKTTPALRFSEAGKREVGATDDKWGSYAWMDLKAQSMRSLHLARTCSNNNHHQLEFHLPLCFCAVLLPSVLGAIQDVRAL